MAIVVTGSLGYDYIMGFPGKIADRIMPDKIHTISLSLLTDRLNKQFGGTAGNIAYSLHLLGQEPIILTYAGFDVAPYKAFLRKNKMTSSYIAVDKTKASGTYFVVTDHDDNQIGAYYKGALVNTPKLPLRTVKTPFDFVVISSNEPQAMVMYVKECITGNIPYMYDPSFQIGDFSKKELRDGISHAAIVIGNDYELSLLEKRAALTHKQLVRMTPIVITTLGSEGSIIESQGKRIVIAPAKAKAIVDPTGAGDAYRSGFLAGFLRGFDLTTCGQMGSVSAVYTVEMYGTQTHRYSRKAFCARYTENYHHTLHV